MPHRTQTEIFPEKGARAQWTETLGQGAWWTVNYKLFLFLMILFIYFLERAWNGGRKKRRETSIACLSYAPTRIAGLQPRHVPWPGIKSATFFGSTGGHSMHWATTARLNFKLFKTTITYYVHMQKDSSNVWRVKSEGHFSFQWESKGTNKSYNVHWSTVP